MSKPKTECSSVATPDSYKLDEVVARARRIETRLTSFLEAQGHETNVKRPIWDARGIVDVPSLRTSVEDILGAIPRGAAFVTLTHHGAVIARLELPKRE